jgi:hypothetical protein
VPVVGLWQNRTTRPSSCPQCNGRVRREAAATRQLTEALGSDLPQGEVLRGPLPRGREDLASLGHHLYDQGENRHERDTLLRP